MNRRPRPRHVSHDHRRTFLGRVVDRARLASRLAVAARPRLAGARPTAPPGSEPLAGRDRPARTSGPKAKRVIFLYMAGGPSHLETFDYKPKLAELRRPADARVVHQGPADRPAPGAEAQRASGRSHEFQKCGKSGQEISDLFPHLGDDRRRHLHRPLDAHRRDQPRPGAHVHEHRHDHLGPAEHGLVGHLRPRAASATTCPASSC